MTETRNYAYWTTFIRKIDKNRNNGVFLVQVKNGRVKIPRYF